MMDSSKKILSERYEVARKIVHNLRDNGADALLPLPRIMVAGQQSAGKSSMLEVLSQIKFPQSSGTCTRQCTELRLTKTSKGSPFRGVLRVRWGVKKGEEDKRRWHSIALDANDSSDGGDSTNDEDYVEIMHKTKPRQPPCDEPCIAIAKIEDVAKTLQQATTRLMGENPTGFSDSVIVLEISSDSVENFEVIDTPGIVEAGEATEEIEWLREMISGYMREKNTVILATVECQGDLKNQRFLEMVRSADPSQERTKLVLTKADRVEEQDEDRWVEIVRGEGEWAEYSRVHGVHAVSCRTPQELKTGVSESDREGRERDVFAKPMWESVDSENIGSWNLKSEINSLMNELVDRTLPKIFKKAQADLDKVDSILSNLPKAIPDSPGARSGALGRLLNRFVEDVKQMLNLAPATNGRGGVCPEISRIQRTFTEQLVKTKPPTDEQENTDDPSVQEASPRSECPSASSSSSSFEELRLASVHVASQSKSEDSVIDLIPDDDSHVKVTINGEIRLGKIHRVIKDFCHVYCANGDAIVKKLNEISRVDPEKEKPLQYRESVRKLLVTERARQLPNVVPEAVRVKLITEVVYQWDLPAHQYLGDVYDLLRQELCEITEELAKDYPKLREVLWNLTESILKTQRERAQTKVADILAAELHPFTTNEHYLRELVVREQRVLEARAYPDNVVDAKMRVLGLETDPKKRNQKVFDMVRTTLKEEDNANDKGKVLDLIALVRAYLKVAYKRVADNVPMMVDQELMHRFHEMIQGSVLTKIFDISDQKRNVLLAEDYKVRDKRSEMLLKQRILSNAVSELRPLCKSEHLASRKRSRDAQDNLASPQEKRHKLYDDSKSKFIFKI
eukprot:995778_1